MTLQEAAQIYIDLVQLEQSLAPDQYQARRKLTFFARNTTTYSAKPFAGQVFAVKIDSKPLAGLLRSLERLLLRPDPIR